MSQTQAIDESGRERTESRAERRSLTPPAEEWSAGLWRAQQRAAEGRARLAQRRDDERRARLITSWLRSLER